jgi:pimeloyl-ACP methyl ester carboxylesterase
VIAHEHVRAGAVSLHCAVAGRPGGSLYLFLHGFPEFWLAWEPYLERFSAHGRAVAPDLRGYNLSDKPEEVEAYAMPHLISDVRALIGHYGDGRPATLIAHDWGGVIAWASAAAHPDLLERLVIVNAPHPAVYARELRANAQQRAASHYVDVFREGPAEELLSADGYAAMRRAVFEAAADPERAFPKPARAAYMEAWSRPGALTGGLNYYRATPLAPAAVRGEAGPLEAAAESIVVRVPTLVIWGMDDTALLPGCLDGLERYVADLTVRRVPEATHWVAHERSDLLMAWIEEFAGLPVSPGPPAAPSPA